MGKDGLNGKDFLIGTFIGGLVGAATALLLAPKPGKELRSDINEQTTYIRLKTEQMKNTAVEKGQSIAETAKDKTTQLSKNISKQSTQVIDKVRGMGKTTLSQLEDEPSDESLEVLESEVENQSPDRDDTLQRKLEETREAFEAVENTMKP